MTTRLRAEEDVVDQFVAVVIVGAPLQCFETLRVGTPAEGAARTLLRGLHGQLALGRRLIRESREIRFARAVWLLEDDARRMDGDRADFGPQVALEVGCPHGGQDRAVALAVQHRPPLQVPGLGTEDWRAVGVRVRGRPGAPCFVRRSGIARSRIELDAIAGGDRGAPAQCSPRRHHLCVARFGFVRAARGALRREPEDFPRIRGGVIQPAFRILMEGGHLLGTGAGGSVGRTGSPSSRYAFPCCQCR